MNDYRRRQYPVRGGVGPAVRPSYVAAVRGHHHLVVIEVWTSRSTARTAQSLPSIISFLATDRPPPARSSAGVRDISSTPAGRPARLPAARLAGAKASQRTNGDAATSTTIARGCEFRGFPAQLGYFETLSAGKTRSNWKMLGPFATASRRYIAIHQMSLLSHASYSYSAGGVRCPRQRRQRQRVTEGTAMAPWNGPKNSVKAQVPRKQLPRSILAASSWHPREDVRNKSCASGSWNLKNDTTHGQTGSTTHRSRPPADRPIR